MERALIGLAFLAFSSQGLAHQFSLGSMDIQPCSKTESAASGGSKQRATLVLTINAPDFQRVRDELRQCAEQGVAAATLRGLVRNAPGSAASFWTEFQVCTRYIEWDSADLAVEASCR